MKYSGIGGQAVMEGVMMRNKDKYAVAVRKPDGEIEVDVQDVKVPKDIWRKIPIVRGVFSFVDSLVVGLKTLSYSASFYEEEDEKRKKMTKEEKQKAEKVEMGFTIFLSFVIALGVFMALPYAANYFLAKVIDSTTICALIEGVIRLVIFIGYVALISLMEDIRRVYMYHGAEHKCINCIEHGLDLTVENVKASSKEHKRCGTSFIFIVLIISVIVFVFIRFDNPGLQILFRLILVPVIAGVSYEFIRLAGRSESKVVAVLSKPGLLLQRLTTREPDDKMIEVGIASVEAVFDWKSFVEEVRADEI